MSFEGTEKKIEILLDPKAHPFRGWERSFWDGVVRRSQATVLSTLSNESSDAYLLSESSLFVHDHRVIMITCGRTTLVESATAILDRLDHDLVRSLIYERKNENFPGMQRSRFEDDAAVLNAILPGTVHCFGDPRGHHLHLFHLNRKCTPDPRDITVEILMYGLDDEARQLFYTNAEASETVVRQKTGIEDTVGGFDVDDHLFDPVGYSLNAIRDDLYFTVHVTPENPGSYASFETNLKLDAGAIQDLVGRTVAFFKPARFDIVVFQESVDLDWNQKTIGYELLSDEHRGLSCGYDVQFAHFSRNPGAVHAAGNSR